MIGSKDASRALRASAPSFETLGELGKLVQQQEREHRDCERREDRTAVVLFANLPHAPHYLRNKADAEKGVVGGPQ